MHLKDKGVGDNCFAGLGESGPSSGVWLWQQGSLAKLRKWPWSYTWSQFEHGWLIIRSVAARAANKQYWCLWSYAAPSSLLQIFLSEDDLSVVRANHVVMKKEQRQIKLPFTLSACSPPEIITVVNPLIPKPAWRREHWCDELHWTRA